MKPMMDGPQASCTPMPLSVSCSDVRTNSNGKTIKLPDAIQGGVLQALEWGASWSVAQDRALSARTCLTS